MMDRLRAKFAIADDKLTNSYVHEVQRNYTDKELERELLKYRRGEKRSQKRKSQTKSQKTIARFADIMLGSSSMKNNNTGMHKAQSILLKKQNEQLE